jgi:hypothetical protein
MLSGTRSISGRRSTASAIIPIPQTRAAPEHSPNGGVGVVGTNQCIRLVAPPAPATSPVPCDLPKQLLRAMAPGRSRPFSTLLRWLLCTQRIRRLSRLSRLVGREWHYGKDCIPQATSTVAPLRDETLNHQRYSNSHHCRTGDAIHDAGRRWPCPQHDSRPGTYGGVDRSREDVTTILERSASRWRMRSSGCARR